MVLSNENTKYKKEIIDLDMNKFNFSFGILALFSCLVKIYYRVIMKHAKLYTHLIKKYQMNIRNYT